LIHVGDCLEVMARLDACSIDSVVTDPPYGIRFMGKAWDGADIENRHGARQAAASHAASAGPNGGHKSVAAEAGKYDLSPKGMRAFQEFSADWAREAIRVLKPGGYCVAFASPRTFHRMVCGLEEAGFEIRDTLMWLFGSGFPKSHNGEWGGTALKPAFEPIVLARKPLAGTVEANWRQHGTGGLNIDGCRVGFGTDADRASAKPGGKATAKGGALAGKGEYPGGDDYAPDTLNIIEADQNVCTTCFYRGIDHRPRAEFVPNDNTAGRWPANLVHDGSDEVLAAFPDAPGQQGDLKGDEPSKPFKNAYGVMNGRGVAKARIDTGSAARFFYCAKASREDRDAGLEAFERRPAGVKNESGRGFSAGDPYAQVVRHNTHPTVKPTDLMRWLCRLVTPPGGLVLDPFTGSGSTGRAAIAEGMRFVGIELDPEYAAIAEARIRITQPGLGF
jgi:DNA modification methylase